MRLIGGDQELSNPATLTAVAVVWAAVAAFWDLRTKRIPNWLTLPAILLGLAVNAVLSGAAGLWASFLGTAVGAALLLVPFAMGGMGAGDVKMLAAVGAIAGPRVVFHSFLYGAIAGGLVAAALLAGRFYLFRGRPARGAGSAARAGARGRFTETFPYGIAIFAGTVVTYVLR